MAQDTVDAVVHLLGESPHRRRCVTKSLPLLGATTKAHDPVTMAQPHARLLGRYGTEAPAGPRPGRGPPRAARAGGGRPALHRRRAPLRRPRGDGPHARRRPGPPDPGRRSSGPRPPWTPPRPWPRSSPADLGWDETAAADQAARFTETRQKELLTAGTRARGDHAHAGHAHRRRAPARSPTASRPGRSTSRRPCSSASPPSGADVVTDDDGPGRGRPGLVAPGHRLGRRGRRARNGRPSWCARARRRRWPPSSPPATRPRVPVTAMAGRSGVCGGSIPVHGGVSLDLTGARRRRSRRRGVADGRRARRHLRSRPRGRARARSGDGYTLGHWPQSMDLSTVGGWLACRGAGQYSTRYGKIEDMVIGLEVVLADGRVVHTEGHGPRRRHRTQPDPALRGQRGHARRHHRGPPAHPPAPARPGAPRLRLHRRSPPGSRPAGASCAAAPRRPCSASTTRPSRPATSSSPTPTCSSSSTRPTRPCWPPPWPWSTRSAAVRTGASCSTSSLVERWLGHRNDVSAAGPAVARRHRGRHGRDLGPVGRAARPLRRGGRRADGGRGHPGGLGPPVARLHRRRLPVLHLRRPRSRDGDDQAWRQDYYRAGLGRRDRGDAWRTAPPSATTTASG